MSTAEKKPWWIDGGVGQCPECNRVFDLTNPDDADEFFNGHDCEPPTTTTNRESIK